MDDTQGREVRVVGRGEWGAAPPLDCHPMPGGRVRHVLYVHYTHTQPCWDLESCSAQMRHLQDRHMRHGGDDIYYNFMLGGDGRVYEGRGWFSQPEKYRRIEKLDPASIYIGYIGDLSGVCSGRVNIIKREWWGGLKPQKGQDWEPFTLPLKYIIFTYTRGKRCTTKGDCLRRVRCLQAIHMQKGMSNIRWNFLIGGDDNVYEGRGWTHKPPKNNTHPELDGRAIEIAYVGNFSAASMRHPTKLMWTRGWQMMMHALKNKIMNELKIAFDWMLGDDEPFGNLFQWPDFPEGHPDRRGPSEGDTTPHTDEVDDPNFHLSWGLRHSPFFAPDPETDAGVRTGNDGGQQAEAPSEDELFRPARSSNQWLPTEAPAKHLNNPFEATGNPMNNLSQATENPMNNLSEATGNPMNNLCKATDNPMNNPTEATKNAMNNSSEAANAPVNKPLEMPGPHLNNPFENMNMASDMLNEKGTLIVNGVNILDRKSQ